jgi:hypothetical protein
MGSEPARMPELQKVLRRQLQVAVAVVEQQRNKFVVVLKFGWGSFSPAATWMDTNQRYKIIDKKRLMRNYGSKCALNSSRQHHQKDKEDALLCSGSYFRIVQ